jgi:hypothetical protein
MAIMESKRDGTCNLCRGPITIGQLIQWDRATGASHYRIEKCEPKVATAKERSSYAEHLVAELNAWDGTGSYRPTSFGDWIHARS